MTSTAIQIMTDDGQNLPLARDVRDALSAWAKREWPNNTAKRAAKAWGVSHSTAVNILKGHASASTLTHVLRKGGWGMAHAVIGAVIGESFEGWLNQEQGRLARARREHEAQEARLVALADRTRAHLGILGDLRPSPTADDAGGMAAELRRVAGRHDRRSDD